MDLTAIAETTIDLWKACEKAYRREYGEAIDIETFKLIFDRAHHHYVSTLIQKDRKGVRDAKETDEEDKVTQAQLKYIIDLGGDPKWYGTKKEASKYIEDLKK